MKTVLVIVSKCDSEGTRIHENVSRRTYQSIGEANYYAATQKAQGLSVLIRPNYNEYDDNGNAYYREWRSFNGEPFKECRFSVSSGLSV